MRVAGAGRAEREGKGLRRNRFDERALIVALRPHCAAIALLAFLARRPAMAERRPPTVEKTGYLGIIGMHDFGVAGGTLGHPGLLFGSRSGTRFRARASDEARPPIVREGVAADRGFGAGSSG